MSNLKLNLIARLTSRIVDKPALGETIDHELGSITIRSSTISGFYMKEILPGLKTGIENPPFTSTELYHKGRLVLSMIDGSVRSYDRSRGWCTDFAQEYRAARRN
jgi:hypothetical protein